MSTSALSAKGSDGGVDRAVVASLATFAVAALLGALALWLHRQRRAKIALGRQRAYPTALGSCASAAPIVMPSLAQPPVSASLASASFGAATHDFSTSFCEMQALDKKADLPVAAGSGTTSIDETRI